MKKIVVVLIIIIAVGVIILGIRFLFGGDEDTWLCDNGEWVKHGNPSAEKPTTPCSNTSNSNTTNSLPTQETVVLGGPRGDLVDPGPVDKECAERLDFYLKNNKNSSCELKESKVGFEECEQYGFSASVAGCAICTLSCTKKSEGENEEQSETMQYNWSTMQQGPYRDKVSYATSNDLLNWDDSGATLAEHASVPGAVYWNSVIYLYFVDVAEDGEPERLGVLTSSDEGQTWSNKQFAQIAGVGDKVPVDPDPFLTNDGKIRLYYFDIDEERSNPGEGRTNKIYSAVSDDGFIFREEDSVRFEKKGIFDPDVLYDGSIYRLFIGDIEGNQTILAKSSDGLNFTEEGVALDGGAVPNAFYDGDKYYLYTAGIDISTSPNGDTYTKTNNRFEKNGIITADPSVIQLKNGNYLMFYKFKD